MSDPVKILIIRLSSLGDILHTLPAFFDIRKSFPDAKIDWVAADTSSSLLSAVPGIDTIHIFDKRAVLPSSVRQTERHSAWTLIRKLRSEHYDCCIDFQGLLKTAFLCFISGATSKIGFPGNLVRERPSHWFYNRTPDNTQKPLHVLELNRMLARCAGARPHNFYFDPVIPDTDSRYIDSLIAKEGLKDFIIVNPGGGWQSKIWPPERYGKLADRIRREKHLQVVVTTGPGEVNLYEKLAAQCSPPPPKHLRVSFLQLVPLLKRARLLIGGDTGPFHLGCALKTPVVGIFGPTSTVRNGPWSDTDEVVTNGVECSGCYKRNCPTDNACMDISVDDVFSAVVRRLNSG